MPSMGRVTAKPPKTVTDAALKIRWGDPRNSGCGGLRLVAGVAVTGRDHGFAQRHAVRECGRGVD
jgi:hypothetical protein